MKSLYEVIPWSGSVASSSSEPPPCRNLVGGHVERVADQRDRLVLDEEIRDVVVRGRDDAPVTNQHRHRIPPGNRAGAAGEGGSRRCRSYLPPGVTFTTRGL